MGWDRTNLAGTCLRSGPRVRPSLPAKSNPCSVLLSRVGHYPGKVMKRVWRFRPPAV